jgi:hypothetical protein
MKNNKCTICGGRGIPGLIQGAGKCQRHWNEGAHLVFERADPEALAKFNEHTKRCTMNCGPHRLDPRSDKERKFLCPECQEVRP